MSAISRLKYLFAGVKSSTALFSLWPWAATCQVMAAPSSRLLSGINGKSPLSMYKTWDLEVVIAVDPADLYLSPQIFIGRK